MAATFDARLDFRERAAGGNFHDPRALPGDRCACALRARFPRLLALRTRRGYAVEHHGFGTLQRGCRHRRLSRDHDAGCAGSVGCLLRGGVLADAVGLPYRTSARLGAPRVADLGADARLRRTPDTVSVGADRALCHSVFHTDHTADSALGAL